MTSLETGPAVVRPLRALVPLLTRLVVAQVFVNAGLHKFEDYGKAVAGFRELGIPAPDVLAGVVASIEIAGGVAIALGLFTRLAAFLLCGVMVVALATAHVKDLEAALVLTPEQGKGLTSIGAVVMLALLAWLLTWGPGPVSVDRLRLRRRNRALALSPAAAAPPAERAHRAKIEPARAQAEREHMPPGRMMGRPPGEPRRADGGTGTRGPASGRLEPEPPPEMDAPGATHL
jgi:putative oxidoreductase